MLNPDARIARARLAAHRRWHPGDDMDELTRECYAELERSHVDEAIDDLVDAAPVMTAAQIARLRRIASVAEPAAEDGAEDGAEDAVAS